MQRFILGIVVAASVVMTLHVDAATAKTSDSSLGGSTRESLVTSQPRSIEDLVKSSGQPARYFKSPSAAAIWFANHPSANIDVPDTDRPMSAGSNDGVRPKTASYSGHGVYTWSTISVEGRGYATLGGNAHGVPFGWSPYLQGSLQYDHGGYYGLTGPVLVKPTYGYLPDYHGCWLSPGQLDYRVSLLNHAKKKVLDVATATAPI